MLKVAIWIGGLYIIFKLCHVNFSPKKGYGPDDRDFLEKLRVGEPYILLAAIMAAALVNLYSYWFVHRLARREIAHATECYGRVSASQNLAGSDKKFDYLVLETFAKDARIVAIEHAKWINSDIPIVYENLAKSEVYYAALYSHLSSRHETDRINEQMVQIDRCLKDQWAPHGEIFNP